MPNSNYCTQCGTLLIGNAKFCNSCGQPVSAVSTNVSIHSSGLPQNPENPVKCSKCGQQDQAISAAQYRAGADTQASQGEDRWDTDLIAMSLARPQKPEPQSLSYWIIAPFIPFLNFIACWFAPINTGLKFYMLGIFLVFVSCAFVPLLYSMSAYAFVGMYWLGFYYLALFISRNKYNADYQNKTLPIYNSSLSQWEHLRYCQRCQVSWTDADPAKTVDVAETESLFKTPELSTPSVSQGGVLHSVLMLLTGLLTAGALCGMLYGLGFAPKPQETLSEEKKAEIFKRVIDDLPDHREIDLDKATRPTDLPEKLQKKFDNSILSEPHKEELEKPLKTKP